MNRAWSRSARHSRQAHQPHVWNRSRLRAANWTRRPWAQAHRQHQDASRHGTQAPVTMRHPSAAWRPRLQACRHRTKRLWRWRTSHLGHRLLHQCVRIQVGEVEQGRSNQRQHRGQDPWELGVRQRVLRRLRAWLEIHDVVGKQVQFRQLQRPRRRLRKAHTHTRRQRNSRPDESRAGWQLDWWSLRTMPLVPSHQVHAHAQKVLETAQTALVRLMKYIFNQCNQLNCLFLLILQIYLLI